MGKRVFNAEMLTLARESRNLTQTALAKCLGVTQGEVSKIENGMREPNPEQVSRFSDALRYTEEFFYVGECIRGPGFGCIYNRRRQSLSAGKLRQIIANINVRRIQFRRYLKATELDVENRFTRFEGSTPAQMAQMVRRYWMIPPGPVQNLVRAIEDAGGIVIPTNFGTQKIDAISQLIPGLPPLFFVNSVSAEDRRRWTLAHEIGHIFMHDVPSEDMEKEADMFAAEFLLPASEIRPQLRDVTVPKLAALKPYWKVSMSALLMRAGDLGWISARQKSYLWMQMGRLGWRKKEPVEIPGEQPSLFNEIIDVHKKELGYTDEDLTTASYWTDVSEMRSTLLHQSSGQNSLRLVK